MPPFLSRANLKPFFHFNFASVKESLFFYTSHMWTNINSKTPKVSAKKIEHEDKEEDAAQKEVKSGWYKWDCIVKGKIYLSKIPSIDEYENQPKAITEAIEADNAKLGLVVSVVTLSDLGNTNIAGPKVWHEMWNEIENESDKPKQILLPIPDQTADIDAKCIAEAVYEMNRVIEEEKKAVLVHCKAGRSRSAMVVSVWLKKKYEETKHMTIEQIEDWIKGKDRDQNPENNRTQVGLTKNQVLKAKETISLMDDLEQNKNFKYHKTIFNFQPSGNFETDLDNLLSSDEFINELRQCWWFNQLGVDSCFNQYYLFNNASSLKIQNIFKKIYEAENADWYFDLLNLQRIKKSNNAESDLQTDLQNSFLAYAKMKTLLSNMSTVTGSLWSNQNSNDSSDVRKSSFYQKFLSELDKLIAGHLKMDVEVFKEKIKILVTHPESDPEAPSTPKFSLRKSCEI